MRVVIHPGFGKSGTTTLQNVLFGSHQAIYSLGRPITERTLPLLKALKNPAMPEEYEAQIGDWVGAALKDKTPEQRCVVLSDETLLNKPDLRWTIAQRLHSLFPEAIILFTIRNQLTAIASHYADHGRILKRVPQPYAGAYVKLADWLTFAEKNWQTSQLGLFDYITTVRHYEQAFGRDQIRILLFEELANNPSEFAVQLADILDLPPTEVRNFLASHRLNKRPSIGEINYHAYRPNLLRGVSLRRLLPFGDALSNTMWKILKRQGPANITLTPDWEAKLQAHYGPANAELAEAYGLPLAENGYMMHAMQ